MSRKEVTVVRRTALGLGVVSILLAAGCGGGGTEQATPTPSCTTVAPGPGGLPTPSPTPCVVGATEEPTAEQTAGEVWKGTIELAVSGTAWTGAWSGTFHIVVDEAGEVSGEGTMERTAGPDGAPLSGGPGLARIDLEVYGRRSGAGFLLRFRISGYGPGVDYEGVSVSFLGAGSSPEYSVPGPVSAGPVNTAEAHGSIEMTCVTCQ